MLLIYITDMGMARFRDGTGKWVRYFLLEFFPVFIGVCEYDFSFAIVLPHILQDCLNLAVPDMRMVATNCSAITDSNTDPSTFSRTGNYYLNNHFLTITYFGCHAFSSS
jgi:hypothetical protein